MTDTEVVIDQIDDAISDEGVETVQQDSASADSDTPDQEDGSEQEGSDESEDDLDESDEDDTRPKRDRKKWSKRKQEAYRERQLAREKKALDKLVANARDWTQASIDSELTWARDRAPEREKLSAISQERLFSEDKIHQQLALSELRMIQARRRQALASERLEVYPEVLSSLSDEQRACLNVQLDGSLSNVAVQVISSTLDNVLALTGYSERLEGRRAYVYRVFHGWDDDSWNADDYLPVGLQASVVDCGLERQPYIESHVRLAELAIDVSRIRLFLNRRPRFIQSMTQDQLRRIVEEDPISWLAFTELGDLKDLIKSVLPLVVVVASDVGYNVRTYGGELDQPEIKEALVAMGYQPRRK